MTHSSQRPLNVLVVGSKFPPEYAGSALRAHATYRRLAATGAVRYEVLTSSVTHNTSLVYEYEGARVTRIARKVSGLHQGDPGEDARPSRLRSLWNVAAYRADYLLEATAAWRWLAPRGRRFDVVHVFGRNHVTAAALTWAKFARKPCLLELVNITDDPRQHEPWIVSRLLGEGLPPQALLVCISPLLADVCRRFGIPEERIWCRPNPVDETRFRFDPAARPALREKAWPGLAEDDALLVYVAKFRLLKNQRFLLDVLSRLPERCRLLLAGPLVETGPLAERQRAYYEEIARAVEAMGLSRRVSLRPGFVERPEDLLGAADAYVMPSTREALGTPVLEALACGVPCVTNDIPGVFDRWVRDGVNGFVRPLDPDAWAGAVQAALALPTEARRRASSEVLAQAATAVIDAQYLERLREAAARP